MRTIALVTFFAATAPLARSADTDSVEAIVHAIYDVISGPAGTRDWVRFRSLFAEGARLIPVRRTSEGAVPAVLTPEGYINRVQPIFEKSPFYESEVSRRIEVFGNIAHVFSTYESRHARGEKPFARGINSIQLVREGQSWKVMTVLWDSEREGNPIPAQYLK
jgi:hypothetical protein